MASMIKIKKFPSRKVYEIEYPTIKKRLKKKHENRLGLSFRMKYHIIKAEVQLTNELTNELTN